DQLVLGQARIDAFRRRLLRPQQLARCHAQHAENLLQLSCARRSLEVLDDVRLDAALAQQLQRLARFAAAWVVVDGDAHRRSLDRGSGRGDGCYFRPSSAPGSTMT